MREALARTVPHALRDVTLQVTPRLSSSVAVTKLLAARVPSCANVHCDETVPGTLTRLDRQLSVQKPQILRRAVIASQLTSSSQPASGLMSR